MKYFTITLLIIFSIRIQSQSPTDGYECSNKVEFKIGYYGNFEWDNGLNFGAEYLWKEKTKIKRRKKGLKTTTHQLLFNGSLGYSKNFTNKTDNGLTTYLGFIYRKTGTKGSQFNIEINPLGYYRSVLPETFEVNENEVSEVTIPGRNYYAPSIAIGIGGLFQNDTSSAWYLNLNCTLRTPYNAGILPTFSLQFGHRFI